MIVNLKQTIHETTFVAGDKAVWLSVHAVCKISLGTCMYILQVAFKLTGGLFSSEM